MQFYLATRGVRPPAAVRFWGPPWALKFTENSLEIALVLAVCAKVRARATLNAKERTFGAQGCQKVPKWSHIGAQNVLKIEVSKKSAESCLDQLFTIYAHYRHPPKTSLFDTSKQAKCRSFPRGASDTAGELQSGAHGAEK